MTRQETVVIITLLAGNYESFSKRTQTDEQVKIIVDTWYSCLGDLDYKLVAQAVKKTMIERPYPPTIHDIRKNAIELMTPRNNTTPIEAWNEAYRLITRGTVVTQEEFDEEPEEIRKFFGTIRQLRDYAMSEDFNMDVLRSNFLRQYEILTQRKQEQNLLPQDIQQRLNGFTQKMLKGE